MGHFHGKNLQILYNRLMREEWDNQLDGKLLWTSQKRKIISMQILRSACVREQVVMTCLALETWAEQGEFKQPNFQSSRICSTESFQASRMNPPRCIS